ncbi:hypothetical protein HanRHA438_Chr16g0763901 [Helianthus annuus]|nr:hypothetical protein HanIR_Chr16g0817181 [Helianthus annuus]KAJ0836171.1 hypothetical protein HanRHA438_Chr16g0763901 [Helianthus annuus]
MYEDCPVAFRWSIPSVIRGIYWDDDWNLNRGMNDEIIYTIEPTDKETPLEGEESAGREEEDDEAVEELQGDPELSDIEPETIMDIEVPPPVQQVANSSHWCPTPWNIDDSFWSDEEGVVEEAELEMADYTAPMEEGAQPPDSMDDYEDGCYPTNPIWDMSDASEVEDDHTLSWEEEFGYELGGLPTLVDEERFDPVGDLTELEALLMEKPTMEFKESPNSAAERADEEFDSRPVENPGDGHPPRSKTREKAKRSLDKPFAKIRGWCRRKKEKEALKSTRHHSSHYMPRIRFGLGKFKYWWSDPFENFKRFINSILKILINNKERVELNGLDRGWIKEKPPDRV